jgi:hypothetical protein
MTDKTISYSGSGQAQKMPGWFSWRHRTRDEHEAARAAYLIQHGPEARRAAAAERNAKADASMRACGHVHGRTGQICEATR